MNEKAADKKAKRNLEYAAAIILCWIPKEKRNEYINYFIASLKDIADGSFFSSNYEYYDYSPLTEDDLP